MGGPEVRASGETLPSRYGKMEAKMARHLAEGSLQGLSQPELQAIWKDTEGPPELYFTWLTGMEAHG